MKVSELDRLVRLFKLHIQVTAAGVYIMKANGGNTEGLAEHYPGATEFLLALQEKEVAPLRDPLKEVTALFVKYGVELEHFREDHDIVAKWWEGDDEKSGEFESLLALVQRLRSI